MADASSSSFGGSDEEESIGLPPFLTDPKGMIKRRWPWMLGALTLAVLTTVTVVFLFKPTFVATAAVLISGQQIPERFVATTVEEDSISAINAMVGQVLAHDSVMPLIESAGLFKDQVGKTPSTNLVQLFRDRTDLYPRQPLSRRRGQSALIYAIDFTSEDPDEAAQVANALASMFVEASIDRRSGQARKATDFMRRQLERDEREQRERAKEAAEFRRVHRGELPSELATNLRRLELLSGRLELLEAQSQSKETQIIALESEPRLSAPSTNETLLLEIQRQFANASAIYTDEHPNVVALEQQLRRLEAKVREETRGTGQSVRLLSEMRELEIIKGQQRSAQREIDEISARVDRTDAIGEQLSLLAQREQVSRENYLKSLRKVEEAELAESLESEQQGALVSILDPAFPPNSPGMSRIQIATFGIAASFALALLVALALELLDPVVIGSDHLEKLVRRQCLGSMPDMTA